MKKEVLRIHDLNHPCAAGRALQWVSFLLFAGECTAFLGLSDSGKDDLLDLLTGKVQTDTEALGISVDGERVRTQKRLEQAVYRIAPREATLREWTCAEYIGLARSGWLLMGRQNRRMLEDTQALADALGLALDGRKKLRSLTEKERRLAELARAVAVGARVLVIEDELEDLTEEELADLSDTIRKVARRRHLTVIVNVHSRAVSRALADSCIVFRDGRIVKKCRQDDLQSEAQLEGYLLGTGQASRRSQDFIAREQGQSGSSLPGAETGNIIYRLRDFPLAGHTVHLLKGSGFAWTSEGLLNLSFCSCGVITLLALEEKVRMRLFLRLSGRAADDTSYCVVGERNLRGGTYPLFVNNRVVSIMHLGSREELFDNMSVKENLVLPSIRKLTFADYVLSSGKLPHALDRSEVLDEAFERAPSESDVNERIAVTLDRWYVYNPKVLVLLDPFEQCDLYGVSIVRSYIRKFTGRGACVIIIRSRSEYVEDISDQMLRIG